MTHDKVTYWLNGPFDEETKAQVRQLQRDPQALSDAFFSNLSFGTGGLRALMGVGTNRLNRYTIQYATQGLANYLKQKTPSPSVVICFDSRINSHEFAQEAAKVMAGNGIRVHLFPELRPTPSLSFACRFLKADAAIMITASHNPKEYNGYKVYWSDGAQVVAPHDTGIEKEMALLNNLNDVHISTLSDPLIKQVSLSALDEAYLNAIAPLQHYPDDNRTQGASLNIVYTSLHGTGITMIPKALASWGFTQVHCVKEQVTIDGTFPTVKVPNPESKQVMQRCVEEMCARNADLAIASDPDADRLGIAILHQGQPHLLTGNEIAAICTDFLCRHSSHLPNRKVVTTIVTTELLKTICKAFNVELIEVLTGFKYIGEVLNHWEVHAPSNHFLFGAEESYGYLIGTHARDKDAIVASCLIAEIALHAKKKQCTLLDLLYQIYQEQGVFREQQLSLNFQPGQEGMEQMSAILHKLRTHPPTTLNGQAIAYIEDYAQGRTLPPSDVLLFRLEDQSRLIIRPSGTEPKLKIYAGVCTPHPTSIPSAIAECDQRLNSLLQATKQLCLP